MSSRLVQIKNWAERAARANYQITALPVDCGVSERQLRRHIESEFGHSPHVWLMMLRLKEAPNLLRQGLPIKVIAGELHFKSTEHFSRAFKKHYRATPHSFRRHLT